VIYWCMPAELVKAIIELLQRKPATIG